MIDDKLIAEVARALVDGGCDWEGIDWCQQKIKEAVRSEIETRVMQEQAQEQEREMVTVTREMAMDAGCPEMEGARIKW